ncbi:MAG: staygreen family protein [Candidatus Hodarchaeota archaeon]
MSYLEKDKLHVSCKESIESDKDFIPRKYTLTHSDSTGELYLTIDCEYNYDQISGLYTRFMRDEVMAEWKKDQDQYELHVYVHVSGGLVFGWARMRYKIFQYHMPLVLKTIRNGDQELFNLFPNLDNSLIYVHFESNKNKYNKIENYGNLKNYIQS